MLDTQRNSLRNHCLSTKFLLLFGVHVVVVIDQRHGAFTAIAPAFQELEVWEPVAVTTPSPPILHRNRHGLVAVKSIIRMKMVLLVFERLVCPVQAEIVQCVSSNTAAFFGIQDILTRIFADFYPYNEKSALPPKKQSAESLVLMP